MWGIYLLTFQKKIQKADGFLIVYDVTNRFSLERTFIYKKKIDSQFGRETIPMVLVGNKSDLSNERQVQMGLLCSYFQVSVSDGIKTGDQFGCAFFESVAINSYKGVDQIFREVIRVIEKKKKVIETAKQEKRDSIREARRKSLRLAINSVLPSGLRTVNSEPSLRKSVSPAPSKEKESTSFCIVS